MKHTTLTLCTALLCTTAAADEWTGRDKELHFAGGAAIAAAVTLATADQNTGFLVGVGVGVAKEVYDATGHGTPSGKDLIVTILGAYIGSRAAGWVITPRSVSYNWRF